jgi:hypothetical protein
MTGTVARELLAAFHDSSWPSVEALVAARRSPHERSTARPALFYFHNGRREAVPIRRDQFLLRTSVEYANPQVTLEELQGIVLARLLAVSAEFAEAHADRRPVAADLPELARRLEERPRDRIVPFVLNVDDIEPDRYSVNPMRASIVRSGQSARAVADVRTEELSVDGEFVDRYRGKLVADRDVQAVRDELSSASTRSYLDLVDRVKYRQLEEASTLLGIDLAIPALRMPLTSLREGGASDALPTLVAAAHRDVPTLRQLYGLFGREFGRRKTTLPAVPHGPGGEASKRLVRGKVVVDGDRITDLEVRYQSGPLYPNEIDPADVARGEASAAFHVDPGRMQSYDFRTTPASPQFALYMLASPEDGAIWHGVGKYAGIQIVETYTAFHRASRATGRFLDVPVDCPADPPQFDLVAEGMLCHPEWKNIDASIACVESLPSLLPRHTRLRTLTLPEAPSRARAAGD